MMKSNEIENTNLNEQAKVTDASEVKSEYAPQAEAPINENSQPGANSWVDKHCDNEILQQSSDMPPEKRKNKPDPVKWVAISLAAVFAATTVFSVSALSKASLNGSSLTGTVTSINGKNITVSISADRGRGFSTMQGGLPQGAPPDMQNGNSDNNSQNNSQSSEQSENSQSNNNSSDSQAVPNENAGQMPDGNGGMPGNFGNSENGDKSGEITVTVGLGTEIKNGSEDIDADDIEVGDSITVTFGAFNSTKSISVNENSAPQGNMPDFNSGNNNSQQDNSKQSNSSNNT